MDVTFFTEMAWKSALISGAVLTLTAALRSRAAADRALVLRIGVVLLLLLPFIALGIPALQIEAWTAPEPLPAASYAAAAEAAIAMPAASGMSPIEATIWDDPTPLVLIAYLGGLLMLGGRLAAGLWMLGQWTRSARDVTCPEWLAAFDRIRWAAPNGDKLRLMVSDAVPSPLSWGWMRPVILIDPDTLARPEEAEAILAHEVAHVARADWPVLMLSRLAAALFWFNPLVRLLEREVVQQAEEAADAAAVDRVEPARYAQTLLIWARTGSGAVPAHAIAPSARALARRMKSILDNRLRERPSGSAWTAIAILLCIGIAAPVAAVELVAAARAAPAAPAAPAPQPSPRPVAIPASSVQAAEAQAAIAAESDELVAVGPIVDEVLASVLPQIPAIVASATAGIDPDEIARTTREALRAHPEVHIDHAEIEKAVREAHQAARAAQIEASRIDHAEIQASVRAGLRSAEVGMARGAAEMEAGARHMEEEAARLRDPAYREQQIARARARGKTLTHEELLEASRGMREGAQGMRKGAEKMRESARNGH